LTQLNAPGFIPQFATTNPNRKDGKFKFHPSQGFKFGADELAGLKIFLTEPAAVPASPAELAAGAIGNCIACHAAPNFTDFKLHNTGVAQREFDDPAVGAGHAAGSFAAFFPSIPTLASRTSNDLPATELHPGASERFQSIPTAGTTLTDLGVWNIFLNPDMSDPQASNPQAKIRAILCEEHLPVACSTVSDSDLLNEAIARFKTPGLRDLSHSNPYMHNGQFDTLENAVGIYLGSSNMARAGTLLNGAKALQGIALLQADIVPLVAFLKSLNEDYQ
jgi:cytochrome c peroxidase